MPDKNKSVASNTAKRMTKPQASKNQKPQDPAARSIATPPVPPPGPKQLACFEAAMKVFNERRYKEAKELAKHET